MVAVVLVTVGSYTVKAQSSYLLDYGPGSPSWCWQMQQEINAISAQNAMLQAQIMRYYNQQAYNVTQHMINTPFQSMSGALTYDGVYITPQDVNSYHKEQVECEHCNGGYNYRTVYLGGGETTQVKSRCSFCHGKGTVTKTVMDY